MRPCAPATITASRSAAEHSASSSAASFFFRAEAGIRVELHALVRVELPGRREQPDVPLADQVGEGQATVLILLGDRDHEAQVALHQLLHRLLVAGAHLPGERDLLLLGEEGRLRHLVEVLVEDVALVLMGAEAGEQTPTPPALLGGGGLRRGGGRDSAGGRAGLRPGGGGGLLPSDVLGHIYQSRITLCYQTQAEKFAYGRKNA